MLPGIVRTGDKINRGISIVVYCDPGGGKTTLASTLPVGETLILNIEAGIGPLLGTGHYVFFLERDLSQLESLYKYLRTEKHPFTNIVLDNISELEEWMIMVLTRGRGKDFPEINEYRDAAAKMREYLRLFRDLSSECGFNVIFNAWEMAFVIEQNTNFATTKAFPKLMKSIAPDLCGLVDVVAHLETYEKTKDRFLRVVGTAKILAKTQFKGLEEFEEANLPQLFEKIRKYNYKKETNSNGGKNV